MFFKRDVVLGQEYLAFLLLNLIDLFLTGYLFRYHGREANGLPAWVLVHFGLRGFAIYKFVLVVLLVVICEVIALSNLRKARLVIIGGCIVYVLVIFWECYLIAAHTDFLAPMPSAALCFLLDHRP